MPRPRPLITKETAKRTLAHRLTRIADRLRQFNTRFGIRSTRVFLVWTKWSGSRRGEGDEKLLARVEILPTPRIQGETAVRRRPYPEGVLPDGTVRLDQVSAGAFTKNNLTGLEIPGIMPEAPRASRGEIVAGTVMDPKSDPRIDFFYEFLEDGRGEEFPPHERYRLLGEVDREEGKLYFSMNLERTSEDLDREGLSQVGKDDVFE